MTTDLTKEQYNKFEDYPQLTYNIIKYLIDNEQTLFRLLKYNDANAYRLDATHPNLTTAEKGQLIYNGIRPQNECRIFQTLGVSDSWQEQVSILRISVLDLIPTNYIIGNVSIIAETYNHDMIDTLSNYSTRTDMITQLLIKNLNGSEIKGLGRLYFDTKATSKCRSTVIGKIPIRGRATVFCNWSQ